jgi:hypothetical protein
MKLRVNIPIEQDYQKPDPNVSGNFSLNEEFNIGTVDFLQVCTILGQFNDLAKRLRK